MSDWQGKLTAMRCPSHRPRGLLPLAAFVLSMFLCTHTSVAQEGGLLLQIDTEYQRTQDPSQIAGLRDVQTAGLSIDANGRMGHGRIAHSAYRFALLPLGVAFYDTKQYVVLNVASGFQVSGVTGHEPLGVLGFVRYPVHRKLCCFLGHSSIV